MPTLDAWRSKLRTAEAMAMLSYAGLLVESVPLKRWRGSLGLATDRGVGPRAAEARKLAARVEHAANLLPFRAKCLPRAMALSWLLRRAGIGHAVVVAVRPPKVRDGPHGLHAWVEVAGDTIISDLPGPWHETLRIGA
ncbi:MAG TPA: lasso peptide biosynthesis B2 protein [Sphingomicrobium sp.]